MFPTAAGADDIPQVTSHSNSSPHSDARDSPESSQDSKQKSNRELTLNMLVKEMVFCLALAITTYGALHSSPSKISKHPQPVRFFNYDSVVTDWYKGQLSNALSSVNSVDIAFVMYYAPWDAESQFVRAHFEKAATVLGDLVYFSAINCWDPGSECRLQHNKIPSWPILMVYTVNSRGILYKGPRDAHSMVRFLELVMKPLDRVASTEDLVSLLSVCDAVAVGYTPFTETSKHYNVWYQVALKALEYDVMGEICFAAVTSEDLALDLGVDSVPSARLMLWNDTKQYKVDTSSPTSWNVTGLMNWVLDNFSQPVARVVPMWKKAFSFERYVDGNPILLLFTPLNPLYEQLPAFGLLREVAMEYYDCKKNGSHWTAELMKLQQVQRLLYQQKDFRKFCQEYKYKKPVRKPKFYKKDVISRNNKYPWSNTTEKSQRVRLFNFLEKRGLTIAKVLESVDDNSELLALGLLHECDNRVLPAEKSFYDHYGQCQSYEESLESKLELESTSMLPYEGDPLSADNLIQEHMKHFCKLINFANEWGPVVKLKRVENENITQVKGLACEKNDSLNMIAVDSVRNHHFAESLGIDIMNKKDMTALVILDTKHESQYILSEEYNAKSVRDFIYNFTRKSLKRSLRTRVEDAAHTHHFGSEGVTEQMGINESTVHVVDLTTKTFRKFVRTPGTVSMVAVCGGVCPAHATRALVRAAQLLGACGVRARAARVDALRHDLPWHYTAAAYPALLVFAATRGGEPDSRVLGTSTRISASALVALALRSLGAPNHLRVRLALCAHAHMAAEKKNCLKDLRNHVTTLIGRNLKYWRRAQAKKLKDAFIKRLKHLHTVHLHFSLLHVSDLNKTSMKQDHLINSLTTLSQNWDIIPFLDRNITVLESS